MAEVQCSRKILCEATTGLDVTLSWIRSKAVAPVYTCSGGPVPMPAATFRLPRAGIATFGGVKQPRNRELPRVGSDWIETSLREQHRLTEKLEEVR